MVLAILLVHVPVVVFVRVLLRVAAHHLVVFTLVVAVAPSVHGVALHPLEGLAVAVLLVHLVDLWAHRLALARGVAHVRWVDVLRVSHGGEGGEEDLVLHRSIKF